MIEREESKREGASMLTDEERRCEEEVRLRWASYPGLGGTLTVPRTLAQQSKRRGEL